MAHIAALSIDSFLTRWQGGEQEELCIGGIYEPGLEVGNSALIPLAKIQSHSQSTERETGECNLVEWPERKWHECSDSLSHRVLLFIWSFGMRSPEPKSHLATTWVRGHPFPVHHLTQPLRGWACPDQVRPELVSAVASDLPPPPPFPLWLRVTIYPLVLPLDSFFISGLSRFLSEHRPYYYVFFLTSDIHAHRLCLKFNISFL